jgi:hypothetical protein
MFVRFDVADVEVVLFGQTQGFAEQDGLADAAQADGDEAFGVAAEFRPAQGDAGALQEIVAASELRRGSSGARGVGV